MTTEKPRNMRFQKNLETLLGALSSAPIIYGYVTPDLNVAFHNELAAEWLGDRTRDFAGCNLRDIVPEHVLSQTKPKVEAALKGEAISYTRAFTFNGKMGSSVANYIPQFEENGKVAGLHIFIWDTTEETRLKREAAIANEMFARAFSSTAVGMAIVGVDGRFLKINDALCQMLGFSADELKSLDFQSITHPEDLFADLERLQELILGQQDSYSLEKRYIRKDGVVAHGILSVSAVRNADQSIAHFVSQIQDISDRHQIQEKLQQEHELLRVTLESIGDAVITFDAQGLVTFLNPAAERITGWSLHDARGQDAVLVFNVNDKSGKPIQSPVTRALETGTVIFLESNCTLEARSGQTIAIEDSAAPIRNAHGDIVGAVLVFHDVTEQRAMADRLEYLAHFDSLTGMANRVLFRDQVSLAIASAKSRNENLALFFCDLDRFKLVNDVHGHHAGDEVLKAIATRLNAVANGALTVCRWSGDEFVLVAPVSGSPHAASELARKIVEVCSEPIWMPSVDSVANIGASVGISIFPVDGSELSDLLGAADSALYEAKRAGRNGFRFHHNTLNTQAKERAKREIQLRAAIRDGRFVVHYQPRISYADGRIRGFEALVRLVSDDGLVYPDQFIDLAESNGLIDDLTFIVFRSACQQMSNWRSTRNSDLGISINLSPSSLKRTDISARLGDILREYSLDAGKFELEITEGILVESSEAIRRQFILLHEMGFFISLDDFGTGFSNLAYLRSLPIDKLKIDRGFISSPNFDAEIAGAIIGLGKSLGMVIVAEGVETKDQEQALIILNCDEGQGFLYSKPLSPEHLERYLLEHTMGCQGKEAMKAVVSFDRRRT